MAARAGGQDSGNVRRALEQPDSSEPYEDGLAVADAILRGGDHKTNRDVVVSVRRQATDFEQLKPEGFDLGEHTVQRGLVGQRSGQRGVLSARLCPQGGER